MNLSLNEEQLLIKNSAEKFFLDNLSFEQRNKILTSDDKLFEDLILKSKELGWYGLPFDQKIGGLGGNITDVMTFANDGNAQNKDFEDKDNDYLDFSETNPFGEP